jgi:dihydrofolate synthase/folylpolyglutamate synthase
VSLGLERIERILAELDHPERSLHGALIAGTNGKGSVVALTASVLRAAGYGVGTMPKPHLVTYRERITVDGNRLSQQAFAAVVQTVLDAVDRIQTDAGAPTEFEVLTAAGFRALADARVDAAVIEVGLGGRLDATNAADLGVAVITNVQHDHERHLGRTLAAIGGEKAAIIKRGDLAVTGATGRGLAPVVARANSVRAPLHRVGSGQAWEARVTDSGWDGVLVDLRTPDGWLRDVRVRLLGRHQGQNAAVATAVLEAIATDAARGGRMLATTESHLRDGLAAARWPGRLEWFPDAAGGRGVLLDGAHNPAGARALARALAELGVRSFPLVFGAMRGKRVNAVLQALAPLDPRPVFTSVADPHAHSPEELLRTWQRVRPDSRGMAGRVAADPVTAMLVAADLTPGRGPVVVAGSLYLVGAVRARLTGERIDP